MSVLQENVTNNSFPVPGIVRAAACYEMKDVEIQVMVYLCAATSSGSILLFVVLNVDKGSHWRQLSLGNLVSMIVKNKGNE